MTILSDRVWQNGQRASGIKVSFEFFPPTSDKAVASLLKTANELVSFEPEFVSSLPSLVSSSCLPLIGTRCMFSY